MPSDAVDIIESALCSVEIYLRSQIENAIEYLVFGLFRKGRVCYLNPGLAHLATLAQSLAHSYGWVVNCFGVHAE